ncbi:MAG: hypothetical protein FWB86_05960 [Treponema sp.]|nr:hypothetical protein [Treponema sp.]
MKKTLIIIACLCTLTVPAVFAQSYTTVLSGQKLDLIDRFEYGTTYEGILSVRNLMKGHRIAANENYTLNITFSVSRDLEDELRVLFVDNTRNKQREENCNTGCSNASSNLTENLWIELSAVNGDSLITGPIKAGQDYTATLKFTTTRRATGISRDANSLAFFTNGEGKKNFKNGGKKGKATITFKEFVLTRD